MELQRLEIVAFRNWTEGVFEPSADGMTAIVGDNGSGKTSLLEAIGWLAMLKSFRGVTTSELVNHDAQQAVLRANLKKETRSFLVEALLPRTGRVKVQMNKQTVKRARDADEYLRVSVFTPDDLELIKGGPSMRREYLDDALSSLNARHDSRRTDLERVLRQRNTFLTQTGPRARAEDLVTLDVWDTKLIELGTAHAKARLQLVTDLAPLVETAYRELTPANPNVSVRITYEAAWMEDGLAIALDKARDSDLRRGVTTVGPHRDELFVELDGLPARTQSSQGQQRGLALALRLAAHRLVGLEIGSPPLLLLDDVFSELDPTRAEALLHALPVGQTLLTTAGHLPDGADPARIVRIVDGAVS
jgi:DNA replication and repair protein RecF